MKQHTIITRTMIAAGLLAGWVLLFLTSCGGVVSTTALPAATTIPPTVTPPALTATPAPLVQLHTLEGHTGMVYGVVFSPDGTQLASGSGVTLMIWDAVTGAQLRTLEGKREVPAFQDVGSYTRKIVWSPDGTMLVALVRSLLGSAGTGMAVKPMLLWDVTVAQPLYLSGHPDTVHDAMFSPDGMTLTSASGKYDYTLIVWDTATGAQIRSLTFSLLTEYTIVDSRAAFSPDGTTLATSGGWSGVSSGPVSGKVFLWDARTGEQMRVLE